MVSAIPPGVELTIATPDKSQVFLPRRQDLPPEAFESAERAAAAFQNRRRQVNVLSYAWRMDGQPDPDGHTLKKVREYMESERNNVESRAEDRLLFIECAAPEPSTPEPVMVHILTLLQASLLLLVSFTAIPQKSKGKRTPEEDGMFITALKSMGKFYASIAGTAVLQLIDVPAATATLEDVIVILLPPACKDWREEMVIRRVEWLLRDAGQSEMAQQSKGKRTPGVMDILSSILAQQFMPDSRPPKLVIRLDTSNGVSAPKAVELLERAIEQSKRTSATRHDVLELKDTIATSFFNSRPYLQRGWPTFEGGAARCTIAHLGQAAAKDARLESTRVGKEYMKADDAQPKLTKIESNAAKTTVSFEAIKWSSFGGDSPKVVLKKLEQTLSTVFFTGRGDMKHVLGLLKDLDETISHAFNQARAESGVKERFACRRTLSPTLRPLVTHSLAWPLTNQNGLESCFPQVLGFDKTYIAESLMEAQGALAGARLFRSIAFLDNDGSKVAPAPEEQEEPKVDDDEPDEKVVIDAVTALEPEDLQ